MSPPSGQTCAAYMQTYIAQAGGYLTNPDATDSCNFCTYRTTDQYIGPSFGIHYAQRWRNLGIFCAFIGANVSQLSSLRPPMLTHYFQDYMYIPVHLALPSALRECYWHYQETLCFSQTFSEGYMTALTVTHSVNDPRLYDIYSLSISFHDTHPLQCKSFEFVSLIILAVDRAAAYKLKIV